MQRLVIVIALALALALAPCAAAAPLAYASQDQAQAYLNHDLKRWAGVDLRSKKYRFHISFCLPGARSRYEKTHPHFPVRRSHTGEPLYHSFACTLAAANRLWHVYLVARSTDRFDVRADT
jgi:hypothetical protein